MLNITPKFPKKVQFLLGLNFPLIDQLVPRKEFVGGRIGYSKQELFLWLLIKKTLGLDYRTVADMAGMAHTTLIRANDRFSKLKIYQKFLIYLIKIAYRKGLINGQKVAMDSSFVKTYSKKQELGSGGWNGHKEAFGFKLHALIDAQSGVLIALITGDGTTHDSKVAIPLLKRARPWLKKCGYVLADKGYDSMDIVEYIAKALKAKASIPIKDTNQKGSKNQKKLSPEERIKGGYQNFKLKAQGRSLKKSIYNQRTEVERFFSTLKRAFKLGKEKTRGITSFIENTYLSCICFMLRRLWIAGVV